jgi:hypothetical protein
VSVVFCQVEVTATGRLLVQNSPTDCDVLCVLRNEVALARFGLLRHRQLYHVICSSYIINNKHFQDKQYLELKLSHGPKLVFDFLFVS